MEEQNVSITKIINEDQDRLEIGTPGKTGALKVCGNFDKPEEFKKKIDKAIEVRAYANTQIAVNI